MISVGIDLGTTNSVCCSIVNGKFNFVKFAGKDTLPSVLLYNDGKVQVGENARRRAVLNAEKFVKSSKTHMGDFSKFWSIDDRNFSPTDVAEEILKHIREQAERHFKTTETISAVITVPAYFSSNQKDETRQAGIKAGFDVKRIVTEPVSAAVAYGFEDNQNGNLFIIDLGGGTFDVSILTVTDDGSDFKVIDVDGDSRLGGDDFDNIILELFLKEIRTSIGIDLSNLQTSGLSNSEYANAKQKLINKAEQLKLELSESLTAEAELPNLFSYNGQFYNFRYELSRSDFEREASYLFQKVEETIQHILNKNPNYASNIDKVILVGGSANLPYIQHLAERQFNKKPLSDMDLAKLVAMGAALICDNEHALASRKTINFQDIVAHSLGVEIDNNKFCKILNKNQYIPVSASKTFTTLKDYQESIDIHIYEGENEDDCNQNAFYGTITLSNIQKAKKGKPKIEVHFEFDHNCILKVTAKDCSTLEEINQTFCSLNKQNKPVKASNQQFDIILLLDTSTSMKGTALEEAQKACLYLIKKLVNLTVHQVGVITFSTTSDIVSPLTQDSKLLQKNIKAIQAGGQTQMGLAIDDAELLFKQSAFNGINRKIVIIITDGGPTQKTETSRSASRLKEQNIQIVTIGVGKNLNETNQKFLQKISSSLQDFHLIDNMSELSTIFTQVVSGITIK